MLQRMNIVKAALIAVVLALSLTASAGTAWADPAGVPSGAITPRPPAEQPGHLRGVSWE
jgi:hypothetical protein